MKNRNVQTVLLVNSREAAQMLAVSPRKLWSMTHEDQPGIPYVRCGRSLRYAVADLQCWIETHRKGGNT